MVLRIGNYRLTQSGKSDKIGVRLRLSDYVAFLFLAFGIGRTTLSIYRPVLLLIGLVWLLLVFKNCAKQLLSDRAVICYLMFVVVYTCLICVSDDLSVTIGYLGSYIIYLLLYMMAAYYFRTTRIKRLVLICKYLLVWIGALSVFAILYYRNHPGAARLYATHRSDLDGYMIGGGYQLAFISAMVLPVIVDHFLKRKGNIWSLFLAIVMLVQIYMATSVLTLLTALLGCFVSFAFSGSKRRKVISITASFLVIGIFIVARNWIGNALINFADNRVVTNFGNMNNAIYVRLTEIGMLLKGNPIINGSVAALRLENYFRPIGNILKSPILGSILTSGVNPSAGNFNDSTIITALVTWGIPMASLNLYPMFYKTRQYKHYVGSVVVLILILLLNPSEGFSLYAGAIILLPALGYVYKSGEMSLGQVKLIR